MKRFKAKAKNQLKEHTRYPPTPFIWEFANKRLSQGRGSNTVCLYKGGNYARGRNILGVEGGLLSTRLCDHISPTLLIVLLYFSRLKWISVHSIATIHCLHVPFYDNNVRMLTLQLDCHVAMLSPEMLSINLQMETSKLLSACMWPAVHA